MTLHTKAVSPDAAVQMKSDWNARAAENSRWYINTLDKNQREDEFNASGLMEVQNQVASCLWLLTGGRDAGSLRLLEIGCGIGRMTRHLAAIFGEVHATDVSEEMIRQATERLTNHSHVHLAATNGSDFQHLPDEHFDVIFSAYVFQHVPQAEIIASNLRDAWRVLAPGGVFRFVVNARTDEEFVRLPKDTWAGAAFPEKEIRKLARELGAQLLGISGENSQYCWVMWRKRTPLSAIQLPAVSPQILACGWADDLKNPTIPCSGDRAFITVLVTGLDEHSADADNTVALLDGEPILPRYTGPADPAFRHAVAEMPGVNFENVLQINLKVPAHAGAGVKSLVIRSSHGQTSVPAHITLA